MAVAMGRPPGRVVGVGHVARYRLQRQQVIRGAIRGGKDEANPVHVLAIHAVEVNSDLGKGQRSHDAFHRRVPRVRNGDPLSNSCAGHLLAVKDCLGDRFLLAGGG